MKFKKLNIVLIACLMLFMWAAQASAELPSYPGNFKGCIGLSSAKLLDYINNSGVYDFRGTPIMGRNSRFIKPVAQFGVKVNGSTSWSDSGSDYDSHPTPVTVTSSDVVSFIDNSSPSPNTNNRLVSRDVQYLITADGEARDTSKIKEAEINVNSGGEINFFAEALEQARATGKDCYIELYECASDIDSNGIGGWSDNGTYAMIKRNDPIYPQGTTWFFTTMLIKVATEGPDFWPSVPSLSYTGTPGTQITIPAMVFNSGNKDTTDFAACWDGGSWANPVSEATNLTIDKGQKIDTPVTVTIPATTQKLWLRANVDSKTPATETNLANNVLSVTVGPVGVDLSVTIHPAAITYNISGSSVTPGATVIVKRKDSGAAPVSAVLTIATPKGTQTIPLTLTAGQRYQIYTDFLVSKAGTYTVSAQVWPGGVPDLYTADNTASCSMAVTKKTPQRQDTDSGIQVQLGG